jgi:predicted phage gp36 major capsid-like protein
VNTPQRQVVDSKPGRASAEYKTAFWNMMRAQRGSFEVSNALQIGSQEAGGFWVPDDYERTLVEGLAEENMFRKLAHIIQTSSGDKKIPVVASKGTAAWVDEAAQIPESDDSFGQVTLGAHKLATMIRVSEELLNDSVFNVEAYITKEFTRRIGAKEEEAFFLGDGVGKPTGLLHATNDATVKILRKLKDSTGNYLWTPSIKEGTPDTILNRPLYTFVYMPITGADAKPILIMRMTSFSRDSSPPLLGMRSFTNTMRKVITTKTPCPPLPNKPS